MLGAIVGDIVGSVYEWLNIKTKEFPLFWNGCAFTDDTIMTCAVAEAVMNGGERDDFINAMRNTVKCIWTWDMAADAWINSDNREPYNSYGNGSVMRVSSCA